MRQSVSAASMRTNAEPMKPAPPVTSTFMLTDGGRSLPLRLPVVVDGGIVVGDAALILRIVEAVRHIHKDGLFRADDLITVGDTGRDQQLPRAQRAEIHGIAKTKSGRTQAQIRQRDLEEALHGSPAVSLVKVIMKRLDGSRIIKSRRKLRGGRREVSRKTPPETLHFEKVAAIVGVNLQALEANSFNQVGRIDSADQLAQTFLAFGQ